MIVSVIAAVANNNVIGKDNKLIWHIPEDLKYFKDLTTGHAIIMGRKTYESIGRPLPNRQNIVISRTPSEYSSDGVTYVSSLQEAIDSAKGNELFIIGGESIYRAAMSLADKLYITRIYADYEGDTFFPEVDENIWQLSGSNDSRRLSSEGVAFSFLTYSRKV